MSLKNKFHKRISVLYDISVFGLALRHEKAKTGVARVIEQVACSLLKMPDLIELNFFVQLRDKNLQEDCLEYIANNPLLAKVPCYIDSVPVCDIYHSTFYPLFDHIPCKVRFITVYDLIPLILPEFFEKPVCDQILYTLSSIKLEDHVLAISNSTKNDLLQNFPVSSEHIHVTHLAANPDIFYRLENNVIFGNMRRHYKIPQDGKYLLSLCTLEPRKNLEHLIRCFITICKTTNITDLFLVLTGAIGWDYEHIFSAINGGKEYKDRIIFTGFVPDENLAALYSGALAFVYVSKYEGFGLPPLEAMQCGIPVITSNNSSLPEVVDDAGIMLESSDDKGLCKAVVEIYSNKRLQRELSIKSLKRAKLFSWDQTAKKTFLAYKKAIEETDSLRVQLTKDNKSLPQILIDGIFFQLMNTGIARLWISLLTEWSKTDFASSILLLDRAGTAPKIQGIRTRLIPEYDYNNTDRDRTMLQAVCDDEKANLFVSTYYTTPITTPSVFYAYDMIPENTPFFDLTNPTWREKHYGIRHAKSFIAISRSTAYDLAKIYPQATNNITIAYPAVDRKIFKPSTEEEILYFKQKYNVTKPYYLFVGHRQSYKNAELLFAAFANFPDKNSFQIVCVGGLPNLEPQLKELVLENSVQILCLVDDELRLAYSGAIAFVYPSLYEGFGLPILEAMACDCPVITCQNSSIPEVAGAAALYVTNNSIDEMAVHLQSVQQNEIREYLIKQGRRQVQKFSWGKMAKEVEDALVKAAHPYTTGD